MSFIGLNLTKNLSYFTVPAVFLTALGPHTWAVIAAGKNFDNANPRGFVDSIIKSETLDKVTKSRILRAQAASDNGFETVGLFAAAVVAANQAGVDIGYLNNASIGYLISRLAFIFTYVHLGENRRLSGLRTAIWGTGIGLIISLYIKAAYKLL